MFGERNTAENVQKEKGTRGLDMEIYCPAHNIHMKCPGCEKEKKDRKTEPKTKKDPGFYPTPCTVRSEVEE